MTLISFFLATVLIFSLISRRVEQSIITAPMVFTIAGVLTMFVVADLGEFQTERNLFLSLAEIGLVMTLFVDATQVNRKKLGRQLQIAIEITRNWNAAHDSTGWRFCLRFVSSLSIWEAGVVGAILAPTDAGLGKIIVNSPKVPRRIRHALNVEAGLNDGISVPFMMFFVAVALNGTSEGGSLMARLVMEQLGLGIAVGFGIGIVGGYLLGFAQIKNWSTGSFRQLGLTVLPLLCVTLSQCVHASMFIAAFIAGFSVQFGFKHAADIGAEFTDEWGQILNYFVFFLFGMIVVRNWAGVHPTLIVYAILSLTLIRMIPVSIALIGTHLSKATVLFMGWFGPRGLASIVLGLAYLEQEAHLPGETTIKLIVTMTILLSIFAHGVSALPGADLYAERIKTLDGSSPELYQDKMARSLNGTIRPRLSLTLPKKST